jgi:serine/threonine protein kinase
MPLQPGDKLGPYEILAPIGKGGMGEVYRAKDTKLDREVAIKALRSALAQDCNRRVDSIGYAPQEETDHDISLCNHRYMLCWLGTAIRAGRRRPYSELQRELHDVSHSREHPSSVAVYGNRW